jgi:hypothetical protein
MESEDILMFQGVQSPHLNPSKDNCLKDTNRHSVQTHDSRSNSAMSNFLNCHNCN